MTKGKRANEWPLGLVDTCVYCASLGKQVVNLAGVTVAYSQNPLYLADADLAILYGR